MLLCIACAPAPQLGGSYYAVQLDDLIAAFWDRMAVYFGRMHEFMPLARVSKPIGYAARLLFHGLSCDIHSVKGLGVMVDFLNRPMCMQMHLLSFACPCTCRVQ